MRKSFWREMALVSAPLLIVGSLWGWSAWQKRRRTPKIELTVRVLENTSSLADNFYSVDFGQRLQWEASLKGGPQAGYRLGWNEQLVAQTARGPIVVWRLDQPGGVWDTQIKFDASTRKGAWKNNASSAAQGSGGGISQFYSGAGLNSASVSGTHLWQEIWPADTKSVEWRAEFVAIPSNSDELWYSPVAAANLQDWAKIKGAVTWKRTIPLKIPPRQLSPVLLLKQQTQPNSELFKNYITVTVLPYQGNSRSFRRLVAFDGKIRRVLWTSAEQDNNRHYYVGGGSGFSNRRGDILSFDLGIVPASWGEVVFLCDTVFTFDPNAPAMVLTRPGPNQNALAQFEKRWSGYRASDRLVLRADKQKAPR